MNDNRLLIPKQFESYQRFINDYELLNSNYFFYVKELSEKHKSVLDIVDKKKVALTENEFKRFTELLYFKLNDLHNTDFDEHQSFNYWAQFFDYHKKPSSLKLRDVLYIEEGSLLYSHLSAFVDDSTMIYDDDNTIKLQLDFIEISKKLSLKEIHEYCKELIGSESSIKKPKLSDRFKCKSIALYHFYSKQSITIENRDKMAYKYGYENGSKLYENYNYFTKESRRVSTGSKSYNTWKEKYFEEAKILLEDKGFKDELRRINKDFEKFKNNIQDNLQ